MSCFIYTDLISSLLDLRLVDPGSILIYVGAYGSKYCMFQTNSVLFLRILPLLMKWLISIVNGSQKGLFMQKEEVFV